MKINKFISQMEPLFGKEEADAVNEYMQNVGFITEFKKTQDFEKSISNFTKSKHCFAVNNGTISLSIAALAMGVKPKDEVIVPNYTMVATPNSIKLLGAEPKFVDINPDTLWIDFDKALDAITKRTKAIFLVSANGRYPSESIDDFIDVLRDKNIAIIEDAAQSLGSYYQDGTHIGLKGDIASFSFSAPKIISTGQGGALITNNEDLAFKIGRIKDFGRSSGGNDTHDFFGINSKFTELQACLGIEQMKKLPERIQRKKEIWKQYSYLLRDCNSIKLFDNDCSTTAPWFIDCLAEERDQLSKFLKSKNVGSRNMYPPLNNQKIYLDNKNHPVSKKVGDIGLWLPSSVQLSNEKITYICGCIHEFYS